jgi:hypothetical protein
VSRPESTLPRVRKTGRVRGAIEPRMSPALRRERAARTKGILVAVRERLRTIPADQIGGVSPDAFLARIEGLLKRLDIEKYPTGRLTRSRGLRWSTFGEVWEEVIAADRALWKELAGYAGANLADLNAALATRKGRRLLNGRGVPLAEVPGGPPARFPAKIEIATDVRLVPEGGSPADAGRTFTDRMLVSFAGGGADGWMTSALDVEIKVPKMKAKLGEQTAEAIPRLTESSYIRMTIVDGNGKVLRTETVPVGRVVVDPGQTTRVGMSGRGGSEELIEFKSGRARGFRETHIRYELPVSTKGAQQIVATIFSRAALTRKR